MLLVQPDCVVRVPVAEVEMSRFRRMAVTIVAVAAVWALGAPAPVAAEVQARTCATADGRYDVTPPPVGSERGADPAAVAAANCSLGFDEQNVYPLSVLGLCLFATAVTLVLVRRKTSFDVMRSGA